MKIIARALGIVALSMGLAAAGRAAGFEDLASNIWSAALAAMRLQRPEQIPALKNEIPPPADRIADVSIADDSFVPAEVTIAKGDWVRWTNNDDEAHTATSVKRIFDTQTIATGKSRKIRFKDEGTFDYLCLFHTMMKGRIVVR